MKKYILTKTEMEAIRNALIEYHQEIKNLNPISPHVQELFKTVEALKNQFKDDVMLQK